MIIVCQELFWEGTIKEIIDKLHVFGYIHNKNSARVFFSRKISKGIFKFTYRGLAFEVKTW